MNEPIYEYTCPGCDAPVDFKLTPGTPAKTYGPPENCYPAEGGECDGPETCPECGHEFDLDKVYELGSDYLADRWSDCDEGPDPDDQRELDFENKRNL